MHYHLFPQLLSDHHRLSPHVLFFKHCQFWSASVKMNYHTSVQMTQNIRQSRQVLPLCVWTVAAHVVHFNKLDVLLNLAPWQRCFLDVWALCLIPCCLGHPVYLLVLTLIKLYITISFQTATTVCQYRINQFPTLTGCNLTKHEPFSTSLCHINLCCHNILWFGIWRPHSPHPAMARTDSLMTPKRRGAGWHEEEK